MGTHSPRSGLLCESDSRDVSFANDGDADAGAFLETSTVILAIQK